MIMFIIFFCSMAFVSWCLCAAASNVSRWEEKYADELKEK